MFLTFQLLKTGFIKPDRKKKNNFLKKGLKIAKSVRHLKNLSAGTVSLLRKSMSHLYTIHYLTSKMLKSCTKQKMLNSLTSKSLVLFSVFIIHKQPQDLGLADVRDHRLGCAFLWD